MWFACWLTSHASLPCSTSPLLPWLGQRTVVQGSECRRQQISSWLVFLLILLQEMKPYSWFLTYILHKLSWQGIVTSSGALLRSVIKLYILVVWFNSLNESEVGQHLSTLPKVHQATTGEQNHLTIEDNRQIFGENSMHSQGFQLAFVRLSRGFSGAFAGL